MSVTKLTNEQRKLVEDNHDLIYGFLHRNDLDIEEYYDIVAIGLCDASKKYNPSIGEFSTFAYKYMNTKIKQNRYLENMQCRKINSITLSYDVECNVKPFEYIDESYINSIIHDDKDIENTFNTSIINIDFSDFLKRLNERERKIIRYLENGYNQTEIGKIMGKTPQAISRTVKKIKNEWLKFNN